MPILADSVRIVQTEISGVVVVDEVFIYGNTRENLTNEWERAVCSMTEHTASDICLFEWILRNCLLKKPDMIN